MLRSGAKKVIKRVRTNSFVPLNQIELSQSATLHNVALVQSQHSGYGIIPVLKANAYGHGLVQIAEILNGAICSFIAVDGSFEAAAIRDITKHRILVMGYIRPENVHLLDTKRCSFVVQDIAGLQAFARLGKPIRIHLELNTGMNRLGLSEEELGDYLTTLRQSPTLTLEGIMTHLADADNELDDSYTLEQVNLFDRLVQRIFSAGFSPKFVHIAQTAGSTKIESAYANGLRLGIGLYGLNPLNINDVKYEQLATLKPVLELKSTIIKVIKLKQGDRVSYNGIFTAPSAMKIGVLPVGYYEGLPRGLSNIGLVTYSQAGVTRELGIVGRVCMNHVMINLNDSDINVGSEVTVISNNNQQPNSISQLSKEHNLFNYSLVTGLAPTIRRRIVQ